MGQAPRVVLLRRLGVLVVAFTFALMVLGSWVKATGSGLSCPDWPACYGQWLPPFPSRDNGGLNPATGDPVAYTQAQILYEWSHRAVASLLGLPLLAFAALAAPTVAWAQRVRDHARLAWLLPPAFLAGLFGAMALLALAIPAGHALRAFASPGMFLGGVVAGSLVAWFLGGPLNPVVRRPGLHTELHPALRRFAVAALAVLAVQVLLGGVTVVGKNAAPLTTAHLATATLFLLCVTCATLFSFLRPQALVERSAFPGEPAHG